VDCKSTLRSEELHGVEVDICEACGGAWFDADELEAVQSTAEPDRQRDNFFSMNVPGGKCPRCSPELLVAGYVGVEPVSRCAFCGGIWVPYPKPTPADQRDRAEVVLAMIKFAILTFRIFL
jgi:Zn-finger nucleic acid-binding protein